MQQGMLFYHQLNPESSVYFQRMIGILHEDLEIPAFQKAWKQVILRHPIFRTSFRWEGLDEPVQDVHANIILPFEIHDWRDLPPLSQQNKFEEFLKLDRQTGLDLAKAPLFRLDLFYLVLNEVYSLYEAYCLGHNIQIDPPRPYRDHIDWLQQLDTSKSETYWKQLLSGFSAPNAIEVISNPGSANGGEEGFGAQEILFPESLTSSLKTLAEKHLLTLNSLVQGAWALLMSRYTGEEDVVFGTVRACRRSSVEGAESIAGLFINTTPVRVRISSDQHPVPWLKELREQHIAGREHEQTPLIQVMAWSDLPPRTPLFESLVVFDAFDLNYRLRKLGESWAHREFHLIEETEFSLTLYGSGGDNLSLKISYDKSRFSDSTIERMLGHLKTLLENIAKNPDRSLSSLPILTYTERHRLLIEWNKTQVEYPQHHCLHHLFEAQVERTPDAVAVRFEEQDLTYRELNNKANQLARHLRKLGVEPETLVGVYMERSLEMVISLYGILKAGGAYVLTGLLLW
jgi:hypothetical protein